MDAPLQSAFNQGPVLIGREPELTAFVEILAGRSTEFPLPAVVVVSGERGMGKTSLMRVFELRAARAGWNTAFIELQKEGANEAAGVEVFCAEVRKKLGFEKDQAFVETVSAVERPTDAAPNSPPARVVLTAPLPSFAQELSGRSRRARILILIDQFEISHPWARWLSEQFLPELKQSQARAVVALACHPEVSTVLRQPGNKVFDLGKLPEQSLWQRLGEIGQGLNPPLTSTELEGYARDPDMRPEIIGSLLRLLELTRRAAGPVSERPEQGQS